jgi:hypothetical protein
MPIHPIRFLADLELNKGKVQEYIERKVLMKILRQTYRYDLPNLIETDLSNKVFSEDYIIHLEKVVIDNAELQLVNVMKFHTYDNPIAIQQLQHAVEVAQIGVDLARARVLRYNPTDLKDIFNIDAGDFTNELGFWSQYKMTRIKHKLPHHKFSNIWNHQPHWLAHWCGYFNRKEINEEIRKLTLREGVLRLGNHKPIVEFLEWMIYINELDTLFIDVSKRWQADIDWLNEYYGK